MSHEGSAEESGATAESPKTPMAPRATSVASTLIESSFGAGTVAAAATAGAEGTEFGIEPWLAGAVEDCWTTCGAVGSDEGAGVGAGVAEGCAHAAARAAAAIVRIGNLATTALQTIETAISLCVEPARQRTEI